MHARLLELFPIFRELPAERLEALLAQGRLVRAARGSAVFGEREACRGFPLLLEGCVRVVKAAPNGREIVLYRVEPGEGCVLSGGCLLAHTDYAATGIASEQSVMFLVPPAFFDELMLGFAPFRRFVFAMYGQRLAEVATLVEEVAFRRLDARLAQLLVRRANVGGIDRLLRVVIGLALLAFLFLGEGSARWLGAIGVIPLLTALISFCPLYSLFGIRTCPVSR